MFLVVKMQVKYNSVFHIFDFIVNYRKFMHDN